MIRFFSLTLIGLCLSSLGWAKPSTSPVDYSADFVKKYGTAGLLASSPPVQLIYKKIEGQCYLVVRSKTGVIGLAEESPDKCRS